MKKMRLEELSTLKRREICAKKNERAKVKKVESIYFKLDIQGELSDKQLLLSY